VTGPNVGASNAFLAKQEDQIQYAQFRRVLKAGWTPPLREEYFRWFNTAGTTYRGGNQCVTALQNIRADGISQLPADAKAAFGALITALMTVGVVPAAAVCDPAWLLTTPAAGESARGFFLCP
jgi:hypothetical protein